MIPFGPSVHVLRIALRDVAPEVWRRITVPSETPLPHLNTILVQAMGWDGYHLHMFVVGDILFGEPDQDDDYMLNEIDVTVKHVLPRIGSSLRWDYDFGDGWKHDVIVESINESTTDTLHPTCLAGANACPPEDCGGVPGYERLVAVLADRVDPEDRRLVAWAPDGFNPTAFDLDATNCKLRNR